MSKRTVVLTLKVDVFGDPDVALKILEESLVGFEATRTDGETVGSVEILKGKEAHWV